MEYGRERKISRDGWVEERCLGSGGFGTVTLYENKITKEHVALKRCRLELNPRNRKRWQQEVDIMKRLDHPNLVSAREVPPPLDVRDDELPLLAMEFCSGGDLRKVLNSPESCCGLKEKTVLRIASDIAAAVDFLHGHRIIHRDLKPENIVISHVNNKVVYKLIDLGYAKELDQGSLATTFVGTLKYLAPELLDKVQYTKTVDYWSFGTVLFECITGMRPFLPELSPVQWHHEIHKKGPDDICAFFDVKGEIQFSSVLPSPNSLCRQLQDKFVALLRLLLLWDPKARGGPVLENGKRKCFDVLEKIVNTVVIHVFSISTATVLSFEVFPSETIEDLQVKLYEVTGVDKEEQELLATSGQPVEPTTLVVDVCNKKDQVEDDCTLFLLPTSNKPMSTRPIYALPPTVKGMVTEPKTLMSYEELKRAFAQGVSFCQEQRKINQLLIEGFRAMLISLLHSNAKVGQSKGDLLSELSKLEAKVDFFNASLQKDVECYTENINLFKNDKILRGWKKAQKKVESFQNNDVLLLRDLTSALQSKVVELQKSPYLSGMQSKSKLDDMYKHAVELYEELRQSDRRPSDSHKMAAVVLQFLAQREKLHKDIFTHLRTVIFCKKEIRGLMTRLHEAKSKLVERADDLTEMQTQRQVDLWKLLQSKKQREQDRRRVSSGSYSSLSSLTSSCCSPQSIVLMEESCRNFEKFTEILNNLKIDQVNDMEMIDWEFLEDAGSDSDKTSV